MGGGQIMSAVDELRRYIIERVQGVDDIDLLDLIYKLLLSES